MSNVYIMLSMHYCYCVVEMGVFFYEVWASPFSRVNFRIQVII